MATEFQEWFRLRALPAIIAAAQQNFQSVHPPAWFDAAAYKQLCDAAGVPVDCPQPMFLVSQDSDSRHSMTHFWPEIDARSRRSSIPKSAIDRRTIPAGQYGHIGIHPLYNYVPTAPKVPDCIQLPIECLFSPIKHEFHKERRARKLQEPSVLMSLVKEVFERDATPERIGKCWDHACKALSVFSALTTETVLIDGVEYSGTHGNVLPKRLRA